jgi:ABC-type methionine transport system ATPase subunit
MVSKVQLTVVASKETVGQPWMWKLARDFSVKVNIQKANIDTDSGWALVELEGPVEEIQRATAWLMTTGMHVEASQRAVGASAHP